MIGYRYPVQGLQPFTKIFGQPLHEPDIEEYIAPASQTEPPLSQQKHDHDIVPDAKYVASQIEKSMGFSYGDDSEGNDSDASVQMEEDAHQPIESESNDDFLAEHSDILPADAPIDTINTLKALKFHIETSENRCFTNLERQLLATIVQHGIFNANNEEEVQKSQESNNVNKQMQDNNSLPLATSTASADLNQYSATHASVITSSDKNSISVGAAQSTSTPTTQFPHELAESNIKEGLVHSMQVKSSITQVPPHLEENYTRESTNPDAMSISRRALLPTPGSYDEISHVLMAEKEGSKIFSKPTLPINEQKKMSKAVKSLKISEKLARIQNSYHPDDEPTLQLLESMANKNEEDSGYDDLLASYSKTKTKLLTAKEPKYKSKTKIIPPSSEFLKRQEKHHASRHERYDKVHHEPQTQAATSSTNRRVVRREDYERERRSKEQERETSRRRVKVQYKEDTPDPNPHSSRPKQNLVMERRRKGKITDEVINKDADAVPDEEAVDILANLITQKFLSSMTEVDQQTSDKNAGSVLDSIADSTVKQTLTQPSSSLPANFPAPSSSAPFLPPPPHVITAPAPILSAPLPIVTGPMMVHPGPVKLGERSNLIQIKLSTATDKKEVVEIDDVEEGEIS